MQVLTLRLIDESELEPVLMLLYDADEDQARVRRLVTDGLHTTYIAFSGQEQIGAATMHWADAESEVEYIATAGDKRGKGYGKMLMAALIEEGRKRQIPAMLVGTDNTAFDTIAFYQKCGFRMYTVRRDFFAYIQPPIMNNGIMLRDMLVLRYDF